MGIRHQAVNDRLRMYHDVEFAYRQAEKKMCFDQFQALVHQSRTVDGNLCAHRPIWMSYRLLDSTNGHLFQCPIAEWAARRGERHLLDFLSALTVQHLKDRIVFRIDGNNAGGGILERPVKDASRRHNAFLVRQSDSCAARDSGERRLERGSAHNRDHYGIGGSRGGGNYSRSPRSYLDAAT